MNFASDQKSIGDCDKEGESMVEPDGIRLGKEGFYTKMKRVLQVFQQLGSI